MNIFTWLLIGHLVGDWLLQNDWMAKGKRQGFLTMPGTVHFAVYTSILMTTLHFSGATNKGLSFVLTLGVLIFVSHWLTDATDVVQGWMRFYQQTQLEQVRLMTDQILHILVLVLITLVCGGV